MRHVKTNITVIIKKQQLDTSLYKSKYLSVQPFDSKESSSEYETLTDIKNRDI